MTYGDLLKLAKKAKAENPLFTVEQIDDILPHSEFEKKDIRLEMIEIAVSEHGKIEETKPSDYDEYADAQD